MWLSYESIEKTLSCSVCLAFCPTTNVFNEGMTSCTHSYYRITEHEISKDHRNAAEAFFLIQQKRILIFFYLQNIIR